jgi:hypothetical protein
VITRGVILLVAALAAAGAPTQQPARDNVKVASGTASISGTVFVDGEPKRPARRVRVTLTSVGRTIPGQTTTTDDKGTFTFQGLPAGRFELQAFKNGYLRSSYGASRPDRAGTAVAVKDGEPVTGLGVTIVRGGVITGTIRDMNGRPVEGVSVRVLRFAYNALSGERTLVAPTGSSFSTSDDRGEYRAYGLPPGGYLVLVPPPVSGGRANVAIHRLTSEDVRRALQAARSTTATASGAAVSAPPAPPSVPVNYAPVFHPGTTDISTAAVVPLGLGEERGGIDVAIQLVPSAKVSGTVTAPSGELPPMLSVRLVPAGPQTELLAGAGLRGTSAQLQAGGTFTFTGVAPGTYTVKAGQGWGRGTPPPGARQWAAADVHVSGEELVVPLTLQPGVPINGRVVFEGETQPTAAELQSLSFMLMPPGAGGQLTSFGGAGKVDAEGRFSFAGVEPDDYRFAFTWNTSAPRDKWTIKAATANGREAYETPLRVNANEPIEWTITFTDKPTTLTGVLTESGGRAATEYYILAFSSDRVHWAPGSRRIRMTRPATDGAFTMKGLPPGEYFLAALLDLEAGEWNDPALLEQLVKSAARITLRDGETTTQNYRMK